MSGLEFVTELEGSEFNNLSLLILITPGIKENKIQAIKYGVSSCILKPFAPE